LDERSIGVFDSGVGGLTVFREIVKILPGENIIYFGDTARFPYGPRNLTEVRHFVFKIADFLADRGVKMIVIACNTSTAAALDDLKKKYSIPVIGVIEPGARTAAHNTLNKKVGLIATQGTVESRAYECAIKRLDPEIRLFPYAAPMLVEFIEAGILAGKQLDDAINGYLKPLMDEDIDVLILGCTHFPLIEQRIKSWSKKRFKVISSAVETAKDVKSALNQLGLSSGRIKTSIGPGDSEGEANSNKFYETGDKSQFLEVGRLFLGGEIKEVIKVKLDM
jgi:glutamate racemase